MVSPQDLDRRAPQAQAIGLVHRVVYRTVRAPPTRQVRCRPADTFARYTATTVPIAAVVLDFDPLLHLGEAVTVRWQTVALAVAVLVCLSAAAVVANRARLRADDLLYLAIGAVPGAVVGGRLGYALLVPDAFAEGPLSLLDPTVGGLELGLGVVGGFISAAVVVDVLGAPVGRWAHHLAVLLLALIAAGKVTMVVGGAGQGLPTDGAWATAYVGPGPWGSLAPDVPSHPSQLYEAAGTLVVAMVLLVVSAAGAFRARDGSRLLVAIAGWALVRAAVSVTWRDGAVVGPLPVGGVLALVIAAGSLFALVLLTVWLPSRRRARADADIPAWPDPDVRPPF